MWMYFNHFQYPVTCNFDLGIFWVEYAVAQWTEIQYVVHLFQWGRAQVDRCVIIRPSSVGLPVLKIFERVSDGGIFLLANLLQSDLLFSFVSVFSPWLSRKNSSHTITVRRKKRYGRSWVADWDDDRWPNQYSVRLCDFLQSYACMEKLNSQVDLGIDPFFCALIISTRLCQSLFYKCNNNTRFRIREGRKRLLLRFLCSFSGAAQPSAVWEVKECTTSNTRDQLLSKTE